MNKKEYSKLDLWNQKNKLYSTIKSQNAKRNLGLDMKFIQKQIEYGIKSMDYYEFTPEEKSFKEIIDLKNEENLNEVEKQRLNDLIAKKREYMSQDEIDKKMSECDKNFREYNSGQYLSKEQKVMYTNSNKNATTKEAIEKLKMHEMMHAVTQGAYDKNGKRVKDMDKLLKSVMQNDPDVRVEDYTIVSGYSKVKLNDKFEAVDIKNNELTEMCIESLAGIMTGEKDKKDFGKFKIPSEMSGYFWTNKPRDLLITAMGNSDFITDMLKEDGVEKLDALNEKLKKEYDSDILDKFNDYLRDSGSLDEEKNNETLSKMEEDLSKLFIARMAKEDPQTEEERKSLQEQLDFFKDNLSTPELKNIDFKSSISMKKEENQKSKEENNFRDDLTDKVNGAVVAENNEKEREEKETQEKNKPDQPQNNVIE